MEEKGVKEELGFYNIKLFISVMSCDYLGVCIIHNISIA